MSLFRKFFGKRLPYFYTNQHVGGYRLRFHTELGAKGKLIAPINGEMNRTMKESLEPNIRIEFYGRKKNVLFSDTSYIAGLKISGEIKDLTRK